MLSAWRASCSGRVAILLSGTTAAEQDLDRVHCPILGVNKSYRLLDAGRTFAHLISGLVSSNTDAPLLLQRYPSLPVFSFRPPRGGTFQTPTGGVPENASLVIVPQISSYSIDAEKGIRWLGAAVAALQLVVFMGFDEVVLIGLDLKRRSRHLKAWEVREGAPLNDYDAARDYAIQGEALDAFAPWLARARPGVRVLNVSHDTACNAFARAPFDEAFP